MQAGLLRHEAGFDGLFLTRSDHQAIVAVCIAGVEVLDMEESVPAVQASLLSEEAGFDALFFARSDYQAIALRRGARASELVWRPPDPAGAGAEEGAVAHGAAWQRRGVFTGTFPNHYCSPGGFAFEWGVDRDPPIQVRSWSPCGCYAVMASS